MTYLFTYFRFLSLKSLSVISYILVLLRPSAKILDFAIKKSKLNIPLSISIILVKCYFLVCYRTDCLRCTWRPKGITWTVSSCSFSTMLPWMMSPTITWRHCTWPLTADITKWPKSSWIRRPTLTLKPWWEQREKESHTHWNLENTLLLFPFSLHFFFGATGFIFLC